MIELSLLAIFMIVAAIIAVESDNLLSSVIAVGAVGFGVCMTFLLLSAPDLALTQLVVEILALVILIRATLGRDVKENYKTPEKASKIGFLIFFTVILIFAFLATLALPNFGMPSMRVAKTYIEEGLQKTGAQNLVTSVILDFRAYDTLGEATVLFTAVIGAIVVLRKRGRKKVTEEDNE